MSLNSLSWKYLIVLIFVYKTNYQQIFFFFERDELYRRMWMNDRIFNTWLNEHNWVRRNGDKSAKR